LYRARHPFGVAAGQIVVDGDHVHALAGQCIQVYRQRAHQGFTFTGAHLGDFAVMQHHAADHLHVEVAHFQHPFGRFAAHGKCFRQQLIQRLAFFHALFEFCGLGLQRLIRQLAQALFQRIDADNSLTILLDQSVVAAAENLFQDIGISCLLLICWQPQNGCSPHVVARWRSHPGREYCCLPVCRIVIWHIGTKQNFQMLPQSKRPPLAARKSCAQQCEAPRNSLNWQR
jgi:hypothetical protein